MLDHTPRPQRPAGDKTTTFKTTMTTDNKSLKDLDDKALYKLWTAHRGETAKTDEVKRATLAGGLLAKRYTEPLQAFFRKRLGDDSQDVFSETLQAFLYGNFRGDGSFRSYVFGIAYNKMLKEFARRSKRKDFDPSVSSLDDLGGSITYVMDKRRVRALVAAALRKIPIDNQQVIELHLIEGHTGPEVAAIVGITLSAFKNRLRRGLEKVRDEIGKLQSTREDHQTGINVIEEWVRTLRDEGDEDNDPT